MTAGPRAGRLTAPGAVEVLHPRRHPREHLGVAIEEEEVVLAVDDALVHGGAAGLQTRDGPRHAGDRDPVVVPTVDDEDGPRQARRAAGPGVAQQHLVLQDARDEDEASVGRGARGGATRDAGAAVREAHEEDAPLVRLQRRHGPRARASRGSIPTPSPPRPRCWTGFRRSAPSAVRGWLDARSASTVTLKDVGTAGRCRAEAELEPQERVLATVAARAAVAAAGGVAAGAAGG